MKQLLLVILIGAAAAAFRHFAQPPALTPETVARAGDKLVMYTTTHCPYCAEARAWLKQNRLAYRECNTDTNEECSMALQRLGADGVPTLVYGDQMRVGWDPVWLSRVLSKL